MGKLRISLFQQIASNFIHSEMMFPLTRTAALFTISPAHECASGRRIRLRECQGMKPTNCLSRRQFLAAQLAGSVWLSSLAGCVNPLIRPQSPDKPLVTDDAESRVRMIGDVSGPFGLNYAKVEGPALIVNLDNTGSDPATGPQREQLISDMQARNVASPNQILASPQTAIVWTRVFIPPAAEPGDPLDVEVRVTDGSETTDLSGGWMLEVRLKEMQIVGGGIHSGHMLAKAEGAVLVDPELSDDADKSNRLRGLILSGARVTKARSFGLVIKTEEKSVYLSKQIGEMLNRRFHTYVHGTKRGVATPKDDSYVDLILHPRYKHNIPRYIRVIRSVPLQESASGKLERLALLENQLNDPISASNAAIKLEAIGKDAIPILRKAIESKDAEIRFYAAEALAYLDDSSAAGPLGEAARDVPAFRVFALTALSTMDDIGASDELKALLDSPSAETRYGAFRALWGMNSSDPLISGEFLKERVHLHQIPSKAAPLVHVTRSFRPEVVLFGEGHHLAAPATLEAGKHLLVRVESESRVTISRFVIGEPDKRVEITNNLAEVIKSLVELGAHYPDVVQCLHEANRNRVLSARLEVDKYPQIGRRYNRASGSDESADVSANNGDEQAYEVGGALPNLFGRRSGGAIIDSERDEKTSTTSE